MEARTSRRRLRRAALLLLCLAAPSPTAVGPAAGGPRATAPLLGSAATWAAAGCEEQAARARDDLARLEVEASGGPRPFDDGDPGEAMVRAELADRLADEPDVLVESVDCAEYPCLVYATAGFAGYAPGWQMVPTIDARMLVGVDGAEPVLYVAYARLRAGDALDAWIPSAQDPVLSRRVQARLEREIARLAAEAGGRVATRAEMARMNQDLATGAYWEREEASARAIGPAPRAPSPCGADLDAALDALDRGRRAAGLARTPVPPDLPPEWQPEAVEARFEAAAEECPEVGAAYLGVDCSEFPCVTMWVGEEPELDRCPRLATPARDRAMWSSGASLRDAAGADAGVSASAYGPPGWYAATKADPTANARMPRRLEDLLIEARGPLGLRGPDALDRVVDRIALWEELSDPFGHIDRAGRLAEAEAERDALLEAMQAERVP